MCGGGHAVVMGLKGLFASDPECLMCWLVAFTEQSGCHSGLPGMLYRVQSRFPTKIIF